MSAGGGWVKGGLLVAAWAWFACGGGGSTNGAGGSMSMGGSPGAGGSGSGGASTCMASGTLSVTASGTSAYVIDGASNPSLTFCRGNSYTFALNAPGHPFYIKTVQGAGTANAYDNGVTGNGTDTGNVVFAVPADAPATLFYNCSLHAPMTGPIHIQ